MKRLVLIARSYDQGLFYSKRFKTEEDAALYGQIISSQRKGTVITYVEEKNSGHCWDIAVIDSSNGEKKISYLLTNSRKNARSIARDLEKYDNTLKIKIYKIY